MFQVCLLSGIVVLLPWGWRPQLAVALASLAGFALAGSHLAASDALVYPIVGLLTGASTSIVGAGFLDRLATQLRVNKSSACRRAIQRILAVVKENVEADKYKSPVEAESDFRELVDREDACK